MWKGSHRVTGQKILKKSERGGDARGHSLERCRRAVTHSYKRKGGGGGQSNNAHGIRGPGEPYSKLSGGTEG